jgi:hypothetical protein
MLYFCYNREVVSLPFSKKRNLTMAIAPASFFTESFEAQMDDLLMRICIELQLDDTRYKLADTNYRAVGKWLEGQTLVALLKPAIYPQGSMCLSTTVRPLVGEEYDLDFVCEFMCPTTFFAQPVDALNLIDQALTANAVYEPMVERMNRCIRLNYEHKFHMDILPACKDSKNGGTCILVPDRELTNWTASNPKGYASWFDERARQVLVPRLLERAEPIPHQESAEKKPPLKLCVQLLKRWRDIRYKENRSVAPISIVLTTLAAQVYSGEQSIARAVENILSGISDRIRSSYPRLVVLNPKNSDEDLSERWDSNPDTYREFVNGTTEFGAQWSELLRTRGIDKVTRALERLFGGELARRVVEKQTRDIEAVRARNELGMKKGSGIITSFVGSSVVPIRPHTFYGEED